MAGIISGIGKVFSSLTGADLLKGGISLANGIFGNQAQKDANATNLAIARLNNDTQRDIARSNNLFQREMLEYNNEWARQQAIDMFNLEANYNSPLEQVKRYREAGLNPAVMMEGAGGIASGNTDAATPSAASSGVSPSMPTFTTPHIEAVPPMSMGFLSALETFADVALKNKQAGKAGAETDRINKLLDQELLNMMSNEKLTQAQTLYQNTIQQLEQLYGGDKRAADIAKTIAEVYRNKMAGNDSAAAAALKKAEKELTDTKNKQLIEQAPVILENLRKSGELIDEQKKTEKAKQAAGYASAEESRAGAGLKREQTETQKEQTKITRKEREVLEQTADDLIFARRLANAKDFQELGEMAVTFEERFKMLRNQRLISEEEYKEAQAKAELAKKENNWYYWHEYLNYLENVSGNIGRLTGSVVGFIK